MRIFYRSLLFLHPPSFRLRFADQMLWIFDESPGLPSRLWLVGDGVQSVVRQWFLRSGLWKAAVAAIVACIPLVMCFGFAILGPPSQCDEHAANNSAQIKLSSR